MFTDTTAEMKRASRGSIAKARFKLRSKYKGSCSSVVKQQGSALIIQTVFYSTVYDLPFADCVLMKTKINVDIFSAS